MSVYPARSVAPCIHLGARQQQQSVRRRRDSLDSGGGRLSHATRRTRRLIMYKSAMAQF